MRVAASRLHVKGNASQSVPVLVPDGLLHPKYTGRRRMGGGIYVLCWRQAISQLWKGFHNTSAPNAVLNPGIHEHIAHLLRLRVLQEFELLAERLEFAVRSGKNQGISNVILRRLTRDEWGLMRSTGTLPYDDAVAVLILPPVNKDTVTKQRPQGNMLALPPADEQRPKELPPISTLLLATSDAWNAELPCTLPKLKTPLYNGISAFPSRSQRAALHSVLLRILYAERSIKRMHASRKPPSSSRSQKGAMPSKPSHAFLLCSDAYTARRGDPASIARALWRLRMYEGEGWMENVSVS
ncbi:hypothetical protein BDZ97DRAFT_1773213 [Flammula alnicola]|nr:hypothetical protein BDZ97DRAFT_1773213 [Flammula alnicola]